MHKYRASKWSFHKLIERVEVEKETAKFVWVKGSGNDWGGVPREAAKTAKSADGVTFHDTWEEAHQHLIELAELNVQGARKALQTAQDKLGNLKGLKKPIEAA
jgi:hypothetical protein